MEEKPGAFFGSGRGRKNGLKLVSPAEMLVTKFASASNFEKNGDSKNQPNLNGTSDLHHLSQFALTYS